MTQRTPKLIPELFIESRCEICGKYRAKGNHQRCSKLRQQRYAGQKEKRDA